MELIRRSVIIDKIEKLIGYYKNTPRTRILQLLTRLMDIIKLGSASGSLITRIDAFLLSRVPENFFGGSIPKKRFIEIEYKNPGTTINKIKLRYFYRYFNKPFFDNNYLHIPKAGNVIQRQLSQEFLDKRLLNLTNPKVKKAIIDCNKLFDEILTFAETPKRSNSKAWNPADVYIELYDALNNKDISIFLGVVKHYGYTEIEKAKMAHKLNMSIIEKTGLDFLISAHQYKHPGVGLWICCNLSWLYYILSDWTSELLIYTVNVDKSRLINIKTDCDASKIKPIQASENPFHVNSSGIINNVIAKYKKQYDGIISCSYMFKGSHHFYNNISQIYDFPSGLIWDISAINNMKLKYIYAKNDAVAKELLAKVYGNIKFKIADITKGYKNKRDTHVMTKGHPAEGDRINRILNDKRIKCKNKLSALDLAGNDYRGNKGTATPEEYLTRKQKDDLIYGNFGYIYILQ